MRSVNFDWIGFTFDSNDYDLIKSRFFSGLDFVEVGHGRLGYNHMEVLDDSVFLLSDGNDNMGVHVDYSSSGLHYFFMSVVRFIKNNHPSDMPFDIDSWASNSSIMCYILKYMLGFGHYSRLDLALDDEYEPYFTPVELNRYWNNRQIVTYAKKHKFIESENGDSFYLGSRQSCIMLRVYDKGKQTKSDHKWIRWEFEIKSAEYCELLIRRFDEIHNLAILFNSYLTSYMKIVVDHGHKIPGRRPCLDKWLIPVIGSIMDP